MEKNPKTSPLIDYVKSDDFKLLLKKVVEEFFDSLHKKIESRMEKVEEQMRQVIDLNNQLIIRKPKPDTSAFQLEVDFALKISDYQDFSKQFVVSPFAIVLGIYPFYKDASIETREKISLLLVEKANDGAFLDLFLDLLSIIHALPNSKSINQDILFYWRNKHTALYKDIVDDFRSTKLKYLESETIVSGASGDSTLDEKTEDIDTILVNYLPFDKQWSFPFCTDFTFQGPFHSSQASQRNEYFMKWPNGRHWYSEDEHFQMIRIRLKGYASLNIFLPKTRFGLSSAIDNLDAEQLCSLIEDVTDSDINITIPKFKIDTKTELGKLIETIGIDQELYQKVRNSIQEKPTAKEKSCSFVHKAQFELNESGVNQPYEILRLEGYGRDDFWTKPKDFVANHPFIFLLTEKDHVIYFGYYQ